MRTELRVEGADCPFCWNDVVDGLRHIDGVTSVTNSMSAGCIAIEYEGIDLASLVQIVHTSLHGVAMSANEIVMSSIDPVVAVLHCTHGATGAHQPDGVPGSAEDAVVELHRLRGPT